MKTLKEKISLLLVDYAGDEWRTNEDTTNEILALFTKEKEKLINEILEIIKQERKKHFPYDNEEDTETISLIKSIYEKE